MYMNKTLLGFHTGVIQRWTPRTYTPMGAEALLQLYTHTHFSHLMAESTWGDKTGQKNVWLNYTMLCEIN